MKLFIATLAASHAVVAKAGSSKKWAELRRRLSFEMVAGYKPQSQSQVTDECAIDRDQAAMELQLALGTAESFDSARKIYNQGGNSKMYAEVTLMSALTKDLVKSEFVYGRGTNGEEIVGKTRQSYSAGDIVIEIYYMTTDVQAYYVHCQVGGLAEPNLRGCFKDTGDLFIGGETYAYTYNPEVENRAGRTIAGFSTNAESKMLTGCPGCPYVDFSYFNNYYDTPTYAHEWVEAAFDGTKTEFKNGNADFSLYGTYGREQVIKKGTAYMNVFMYVIREFEDALDDCMLMPDINYNSLHAWDEGVCFYTGSIEGQDGATNGGKLLHQLADKRCSNFKTCGPDGVDQAGQSKLNYDLFDLFALGNSQIQSGDCSGARQTTATITKLMYVPLIQSAMRSAYKVDRLSGGEKDKAEGAVFAAAVLPRVHAANPDAAVIIYDNIRVGAPSTDFEAVKGAFESVYANMGITCADIGGLIDYSSEAYYPGMEPCTDTTAATATPSKDLTTGDADASTSTSATTSIADSITAAAITAAPASSTETTVSTENPAAQAATNSATTASPSTGFTNEENGVDTSSFTLDKGAGEADSNIYVDACKCNGAASFTCDLDPLKPNEELHVCVLSILPEVEIDNLESMVITQGSTTMNIILADQVQNENMGISSREYVSAHNGVVVSTLIPTNIFSFSAGSDITISGSIELKLPTLFGRNLTEKTNEMAQSYIVVVNLKTGEFVGSEVRSGAGSLVGVHGMAIKLGVIVLGFLILYGY